MNGAPSVESAGRTFKYAEVRVTRTGPGPRIIKMWEDGVADSVHEYLLEPNPHLVPRYVQNPPRFYRELAQAIADDAAALGWPAAGTAYDVDWIQETITLRAP
ncbi:hypothetical protein [Cellulomonas iranensis]|uniref:hypothetical protein n=1 Tax=Cellulomonas iranensis TaxID=76862 RepID=UPI000B3BFDEC|nr:hypothetical protein [Cellulomonas iranensis]